MKPNIPDDMVERAAILFAQWLGYSWDGLPDADISDEYSDWALDGVGRKHLQGGKPAVRRIARSALAEAVMAERGKTRKEEQERLAQWLKAKAMRSGAHVAPALENAAAAIRARSEEQSK